MANVTPSKVLGMDIDNVENLQINKQTNLIDCDHLASIIKNQIENVLIIDSRSFLEYNTCHVSYAVNVCCSKIVKRRLQQDKVSVFKKY